jgi:hypothetical protein
MMENIKEHIIEYMVLVVALVGFICLLVLFRFNKSALLGVSGLGSVFYILWGIIHHALRGRLTRSIAYEYILFGVLVFLLLFTVLSF